MRQGIVIPNQTRMIDAKLAYLLSHPNYCMIKDKLGLKELTSINAMQSYLLEHPDIAENFSNTPRKVKKIARQGAKRIENAWDLLKNVDNLVDKLDIDLIKDIGYEVDPNNYSFRTQSARLGLMLYTAPEPGLIRPKLEHFLEDLKKNDYHPVESSALTHMMIAGIQPFQDGNKRVARLLHNKILYDNKLPVVTVNSRERKVYLDLLEQALSGISFFNDTSKHDHKKIRPFFDYMASKVNMSLDMIAIKYFEDFPYTK